jgi:plastocyanin
MKTAFAAILFLASLATFSDAADVPVNVGNAAGANVFEPAKIMANPGDNIVFTWVSGKHSIFETDSLTDCKTTNPTGISSGGAFASPKTWTYPVPATATGKTWIYCARKLLNSNQREVVKRNNDFPLQWKGTLRSCFPTGECGEATICLIRVERL